MRQRAEVGGADWPSASALRGGEFMVPPVRKLPGRASRLFGWASGFATAGTAGPRPGLGRANVLLPTRSGSGLCPRLRTPRLAVCDTTLLPGLRFRCPVLRTWRPWDRGAEAAQFRAVLAIEASLLTADQRNE